MGGDGGSIPCRADVVRTAGYKFVRNLGGMGYLPNTQVRSGSGKYNKSEERLLKWTHCALTSQPLNPPLIACRLGQLYSKESFIERWLNRKAVALPPSVSHIDSRKDVKDLNVEFDKGSGKLVCPLSKVEFDSGVRGVFFWPCGCVVSSKALERLSGTSNSMPSDEAVASSTSSTAKHLSKTTKKPGAENNRGGGAVARRPCPVCGVTYDVHNDVIQLVPDVESLPDLKGRLLEEKLKNRVAKRSGCETGSSSIKKQKAETLQAV